MAGQMPVVLSSSRYEGDARPWGLERLSLARSVFCFGSRPTFRVASSFSLLPPPLPLPKKNHGRLLWFTIDGDERSFCELSVGETSFHKELHRASACNFFTMMWTSHTLCWWLFLLKAATKWTISESTLAAVNHTSAEAFHRRLSHHADINAIVTGSSVSFGGLFLLEGSAEPLPEQS